MNTVAASAGSLMDRGAGSRNRSGRPVIGVSAHSGRVRLGMWETDATLLPQIVVSLLDAAECVPVLLPPLAGIDDIVGRLDGLLIPGGGDVDPAAYGTAAHPETARVDSRRDAAEFALLSAALGAGLPVLGVCRGLQVLNVFRGGTLHQHLPDITGSEDHEGQPGGFAPHTLRLESGSRIAAILGGDSAVRPCRHHQAIDQLGIGLTATAWSADGIVHAAEIADYPFALGVQWEVVSNGDEDLVRALAAAARQVWTRRSRRYS